MGLRVTKITRTAKVNLGRNGIGKYTFRIDNKDPIYKKLIKLPTVNLKSNSSKYTIDSHIGTVELKSILDVKLKQEDNKIVLYEGDLPLSLNGKDFIIKQEDIIGEHSDDIIKEFISGEEVLISLEYIESSPNFGIDLSDYRYGKGRLKLALKFIDFHDGSDRVLQKIKEKKGGLYFTIEGNNIYISSDKDGNCLLAYDTYQCQYTQNTRDVLTIDDIISLIEASNAQKDTMDNLREANNIQQNFALKQGENYWKVSMKQIIVLNDKTIATLPKIGYYMLNDQLAMRVITLRKKR